MRQTAARCMFEMPQQFYRNVYVCSLALFRMKLSHYFKELVTFP